MRGDGRRASRSLSKRSLSVSKVTLAEVCPSVRCSDRTSTPADTASDAQLCLRSCERQRIRGLVSARRGQPIENEPRHRHGPALASFPEPHRVVDADLAPTDRFKTKAAPAPTGAAFTCLLENNAYTSVV